MTSSILTVKVEGVHLHTLICHANYYDDLINVVSIFLSKRALRIGLNLARIIRISQLIKVSQNELPG